MIDEEDIKNVETAFESFFDGLGPDDVYKRIMLEVLLEEIYGTSVDLTEIVEKKE